MRRIIYVFILLLIATIAFAQNGKASTPEERQRAIEVAHRMEANPLDKSLQPDREWLLKWSIEAPDFTVSMCSSHGEFKKKFRYSSEVTFQKLASAIAFVLEHPEQDKTAQEMAGVNGALNAYEQILKVDSKGHSEYWDSLLEKRSAGTLNDFVAAYVKSDCSK